MDLQTVFYTLGIIFYILSILILLGISIGVFLLYRKINQIYQQIDEKIEAVRRIANDPSELAASLGAGVASSAIRKVGSMMNGNKRRKS